MAPRVLISDKLSPAAVAIFKERGVEVDVKPGLDKDELAEDHRRVRRPRHPLGDQGHRQAARARDEAEGRRPRRHRRRQRRHPGRHRPRRHRDEHAVRQFDHHRRARDRADVRARPPDPDGRRFHPGGQVGEEPLHGRRTHRQDARRDRLRQHRLDRRLARHRPQDAGRRLRPVPQPRARRRDRRREGRTRRPARPRRLHHPAHADDRADARTFCRPKTSPRPRRACASSTAPAAVWSTRPL